MVEIDEEIVVRDHVIDHVHVHDHVHDQDQDQDHIQNRQIVLAANIDMIVTAREDTTINMKDIIAGLLIVNMTEKETDHWSDDAENINIFS